MKLKVTGCGLSQELELSGDISLDTVLSRVADVLGLAPQHIKLLFRGKLLAGETSLEDAGIKDRTRLMAMHTELFHREKSALEAMAALEKEAAAIDPESRHTEELFTQLLCKLDAIDVSSSDWLRAQRKKLITSLHSYSNLDQR